LGPRERKDGRTDAGSQVSRRRFLQGAAGAAVGAVAGRYLSAAQPALAAGITCPNPNPIVNENRCVTSGWSPGFQMAPGTYSGSVTGSGERVEAGRPVEVAQLLVGDGAVGHEVGGRRVRSRVELGIAPAPPGEPRQHDEGQEKPRDHQLVR
jgi:hypothetical protein